MACRSTLVAVVVLVAGMAAAVGATACVEAGNAKPSVYVLHAGDNRVPVSPVPLADDMDAWAAGPGGGMVKLTDLPARFLSQGVKGFFPDQATPMADGTALKLKCPDTCGGAACEFFIAVYHCPPCSTATSGGLPTLLPQEGWRGAGCAPRFVTPGSDSRHRMVMFKHIVHADQYYITPPLGPLRNVAVFAKVGVAECNASWKPAACKANPGCRWANGVCTSAWCPAPVGPVAPGAGAGGAGAPSACTACAQPTLGTP